MKVKKETLRGGDDHISVKEYNENGKLIYFKNSSGYEEWYEYDADGNEIHYKNSAGTESWKEYEYFI